MFAKSYEDVCAEASDTARASEARLFNEILDALETAHDTQARRDALARLSELWTTLLDALVDAENALPGPLRAQLVSLGLFSLREIDAARRDPDYDLDDLVFVARSIASGLS